MPFKLTKNQCALLVGALTLFIVYLWGCRCMERKPAVGGSLVSSGGAQQVVYINPSSYDNQIRRFKAPLWGWQLYPRNVDFYHGYGSLQIVTLIDSTFDRRTGEVLKRGHGSDNNLILTLSGTDVSGMVGGHHTGTFYRSPGGEVHSAGGKVVGDKPLQLTLQQVPVASLANFAYYLKDPTDGLFLGFTDQYARQDGPAPLVMGSLSDSNFQPFVGQSNIEL